MWPVFCKDTLKSASGHVYALSKNEYLGYVLRYSKPSSLDDGQNINPLVWVLVGKNQTGFRSRLNNK